MRLQDKLDLLKVYQACQDGDGRGETRPSDLMSRLTASIRPICGYCGVKCGNKWMERSDVSTDLRHTHDKLQLCIDCYAHGAPEELGQVGSYREAYILEEVCKIDQKQPPKEWMFEEKLKLLETFEECQFDLQRVVQRFPGRTPREIIKAFLTIPLHNFNGILKLTNQHFENIFKKESTAVQPESVDEILPYHVYL